jgi:hypothetical protein
MFDEIKLADHCMSHGSGSAWTQATASHCWYCSGGQPRSTTSSHSSSAEPKAHNRSAACSAVRLLDARNATRPRLALARSRDVVLKVIKYGGSILPHKNTYVGEALAPSYQAIRAEVTPRIDAAALARWATVSS